MFEKTLTDKVSLLSSVLRQMAYIKNLPFELDPNLKNGSPDACLALTLVDDRSLFKIKIRSYILTAVLITLLLQVVLPKIINSDSSVTDHDLVGCSMFIMLCILTIHVHQTRHRRYDLAGYLNGLLRFNEVHKKYLPRTEKMPLVEFLNMAFVPTALFNGVVFPPLFMLGFHWTNPCKLSLAGYIFLPECQQNGSEQQEVGIYGQVMKIMLLAFNCWAWFFGIHGTIFLVTSLKILSIFFIRDGLLSLWNQLSLDSESKKKAGIYRELQLLNLLCNKAQKGSLAVLVIGSIFILATSFAVLVRMAAKEDSSLTMMLVMAVASLDAGVALLIVTTGMVSVHSESRKILQQVKWPFLIKQGDAIVPNVKWGYHHRDNKKWQKRYWKSCTLIKIHFTRSNFVDELTPLNCMDSAANMAVQFLLMN